MNLRINFSEWWKTSRSFVVPTASFTKVYLIVFKSIKHLIPVVGCIFAKTFKFDLMSLLKIQAMKILQFCILLYFVEFYFFLLHYYFHFFFFYCTLVFISFKNYGFKPP